MRSLGASDVYKTNPLQSNSTALLMAALVEERKLFSDSDSFPESRDMGPELEANIAGVAEGERVRLEAELAQLQKEQEQLEEELRDSRSSETSKDFEEDTYSGQSEELGSSQKGSVSPKGLIRMITEVSLDLSIDDVAFELDTLFDRSSKRGRVRYGTFIEWLMSHLLGRHLQAEDARLREERAELDAEIALSCSNTDGLLGFSQDTLNVTWDSLAAEHSSLQEESERLRRELGW